jgi:hypothetical protein
VAVAGGARQLEGGQRAALSIAAPGPATCDVPATASGGASCGAQRARHQVFGTRMPAQPASEGPRPRAACEHGRVVNRRNSDGEQPSIYGRSTSSATASPPPRHSVAMPRLALRSAIA